MEHAVDFTITKVYEPEKDNKPIEGTGEYGAWKLYNFYTDKHGKEKFSFMWGEKKPVPTVGLKIKHMEYESETKGQYTNLNVKKIEIDPASKGEAIPNAKEDMGSIPKAKNDSEVSYYVSYMKDIVTAMIAAGHNVEKTDLGAVARGIAKAGIVMMNESLYNTEIPPEKPTTASESSKPEEGKPTPSGPNKDKLTEAFLRSVEDIQTALVMSLGESEAAKAVDSTLNRYEAKSFEDVKKPEHGAFIAHLASFQDKG